MRGEEAIAEPHSWPRTIGAHLLPGVLAFLVFVPAARLGTPRGLPAAFALFLAMLVVLVPFELGVLLRAGRNAAWSEVIPYTKRLPVLHYVAAVPLLVAWAFVLFFAIGPHEERFFAQAVVPWPPGWLIGPAGPAPSPTLAISTWAFGLLVNGLAVPLVEELYFRGYLLPRIPCRERWSPLVSAVLFSVYHFFSPWQNLTRTLAVAPMSYAVSRTRSVWVSVLAHGLLNTIAMLLALPGLLR